jgi:hypothetical protein
MALPKSYRDWRCRANAYLAPHIPGVDAYADNHVLAALRHSAPGDRLWAEARDHGFWEAEHAREMER